MTSQSGPQDSLLEENKLWLGHAAEAYKAGELAQAATLCEAIFKNSPEHMRDPLNFALTCSLMAAVCMEQKRIDEALEYSKQAYSLAPQNDVVVSNYADILNRSEDFEQALEISDTALTLNPDLAEAHMNRGTALTGLYRFVEARKSYEQAMALNPQLKASAYGNLAYMHGKEGQYETSRKLSELAIKEDPSSYSLVANRQSVSMYTPSVTPRDERDRTKALWDVTPLTGGPLKRTGSHDCSSDRRLRVGYFSADFRNHPVSLFLRPVLERHDRDNFQFFMYDVTQKTDETSTVLRTLVDAYHNGLTQSDEQLAQKIADDQIDILVDLTGVFENNRLNVFRYKPAPIQMMWIGYSGTSALPEMDYVIADAYVCPQGADVDFSENILRLPQHYLSYDAPDIAVSAQNPFARPATGTMFGNFNNHMKLNSDVIRVWSEILKRVPNSSLYLKTRGFEEAGLRRHVRRQFEARGLASERLKISGRVSSEAHMNAYNDVDIALDPFPYCGTTTTVEALSMGVPVVTLVGERWVQRTSYGFLKGMGWDELCASSEKEYADIAINLAKDPAKVRAMKAIGREKFLASPVCDTERLTRDVEAAYRDVWQRYCKENLTAH